MKAIEFLGGERQTEGSWEFVLPVELHGAFGGAFGGVQAACAVAAARSLADGRAPCALDCRFVRGLPAGPAELSPTVIHQGRSLSCVSVDVLDERGRLATRATVSLVDPGTLHRIDRAGAAATTSGWPGYETGSPWRSPPGAGIPIVATIAPRIVGEDERGVATALRVPWDDEDAAAEAACLAADLCVGPPVAMALRGERVLHPNPDLSLRFAAAPSHELVGVGRLEVIVAGLAVVHVEVWSGGELAAVGVSTSLLLPRPA